MEPEVDALFTDTLRAEAARSFGADPESLQTLAGFENYVFGYTRDNEQRILRVTHPSHRSAEQMRAELDWVEHLASHGVRIARPVLSPQGNYTETVSDGEGTFHVCSVTRVPGRPPVADDWQPEFFRRWGAIIGRMHRITRDYKPSPGIAPRLRWDDDPYWIHGKSYIPETYPEIIRRWDELAAHLRSLSETPDAFGICHTDLHMGNFHLHDGEIHAFDTDDCMHHWFVEDLSSLLYYGRGFGGDKPDDFAQHAWPQIWAGYQSEYPLDPSWIDHLESFMQFRRILLFALIHFKLAPDDPEGQEVVTRNAPRIRDGEPIFGVNLRSLITP